MPPKKTNIVKSGNAPSSKEKKSNDPSPSASAGPPPPPPLFPPGSKYPLSLLNERSARNPFPSLLFSYQAKMPETRLGEAIGGHSEPYYCIPFINS